MKLQNDQFHDDFNHENYNTEESQSWGQAKISREKQRIIEASPENETSK